MLFILQLVTCLQTVFSIKMGIIDLFIGGFGVGISNNRFYNNYILHSVREIEIYKGKTI